MQIKPNIRAERRAVIAGLAGASLLIPHSRPWAQAAGLNQQTLAALRSTATAADNLVIRIASYAPDAADLPASDLRGVGAQIAANGAEILGSVPPDARALYVIPLNWHLATALNEAQIDLVPSPSEAAAEMTRLPAGDAIADDRDPLWSIVLDIVLDTFGIREVASTLVREKARLATLSALLEELKGAIRSRNSALIALHCERLFGYLGTAHFRNALVGLVGPQAANRMLASIAARLVPFIGWSLTVACFLLAVHRNWEKIEAHL